METALGPIAVTDEGARDAPPVLCVHGLPGSSRDFRYLAPQLLPEWRVVRVEMPGFGLSPDRLPHTLDGWAAALDALRSALDLERPLLLAHSFGGGACLLAAAGTASWRGPALLASLGARVHPAMRWSPATYRRLAASVRSPLLGGPLATLFSRGYDRLGLPRPRTRAELLHHLDLLASVDFGAIALAARRALAPSLVAYCRDDRVSRPDIQEELAALLPDCEPVRFDRGGHHLHKHRAAEVAAAVSARFL